MSERKVLNKYYPPDYDPANIPRCKEKRNSTFIIRVMAPCNMRCTTCGEYIYKGRKFNARKEDVDDMNHLGLRIYRFYIKCTACVSEISFRTDPATTDYVLEAGATRNFEALAKAERQAEAEQKAHQEELASNPMKMLEERTEQSKNEMARMEALEELQEQNKREIEIDYENLLGGYEKAAQAQKEKQEKEDEEYVKTLFGEHGDGSVKRILDDDEDDDSDDDTKRFTKKIKTEKATDLLGQVDAKKKENEKKEAWEKSIGTLGAKKKNGLGIVVKKKTAPANSFVKPASTATASSAPAAPSTSSSSSSSSSSSTSTSTATKPTIGGLGLLADYSDSEEDSS